jgi:hypothetical protein
MKNLQLILFFLLGLICFSNLLVSFFVARSSFYSTGQKVAQCLIIWFIPIFGAAGIGIFLSVQSNSGRYDPNASPDYSEKMSTLVQCHH